MNQVMLMIELKNPYPGITDGNDIFYGGCQRLFSNRSMSGYGCGVIAVCDLLLYLNETKKDFNLPELPKKTDGVYSFGEYERFAGKLMKRYLPIIPYSGINGLTLMLGVQAFFNRHHLPYKAIWGMSGKKTTERIREMLSEDIPAIISVGPNFPRLWGKRRLNFLQKNRSGAILPVCSTNSHYVTVTGIDEDYLQISSWGKKYYISIDDYKKYAAEESADFLCNILYISHR